MQPSLVNDSDTLTPVYVCERQSLGPARILDIVVVETVWTWLIDTSIDLNEGVDMMIALNDGVEIGWHTARYVHVASCA